MRVIITVLHIMVCFFTGVTETTLKKTEEQLAVLEDLVKDSQFDSELKELDKKFVTLQDQKFAELERLKSNSNQNI